VNLQTLQLQLQAELQKQHPEYAPHHLQLLAHGESNAIYQLNQNVLVRVAVSTPNQRFQGKIWHVTQFEQRILDYLKGTAIGHDLQSAWLTPTSDFPYSYLITNFLEGRSLTYSRDDLNKCAHTLARLHRLPRSATHPLERLRVYMPVIQNPLTLFYQESKAYAQPYLDSDRAEPEIVEMLHAVLVKAKARLPTERLLLDYPYVCLVHSDHTCDNWVINQQQAYLIDWEWAELSSPAGDLGHFLSPVTIQRYQGYQLPTEDREFFLQTYYSALEDDELSQIIQKHFVAFGVYPAVRSLCWTAGYWVTAVRWYEASLENSPSAENRLKRFEESRRQFPILWRSVMDKLEEEVT
jgi:thiamine kinase-like enzyme